MDTARQERVDRVANALSFLSQQEEPVTAQVDKLTEEDCKQYESGYCSLYGHQCFGLSHCTGDFDETDG